MKILIFFISVLLSANLFQFSGNKSDQGENITCISDNEKALYDAVNAYRKQHNLKSIPLSLSLTVVAQTHVRDLIENEPFDDAGKCNPHSWSDKGNWKACCYNSGKDGECMWNKPRELTNYDSDGYEIVMHWFNESKPFEDVPASEALQTWKESTNHDNVILNKGIWKSSEWNAMGVGIYQGFAAIWFGTLSDSAGEPAMCEK